MADDDEEPSVPAARRTLGAVVDGLDRRGFVALGMGALVTACTAGQRGSTPARPRREASSPGASAHAATPTPSVTPWHPDTGDVEPAAKIAAVRAVEACERSRDSTLEVVEAQYGGILADAACVLVVCRRWVVRSGRSLPAGGSTYDVRLVRSARRWRITAVHPSHPGPPARRLTAAARRVLASPRIDLPPASRADVLSGRVHESVLTAMLTLSARYRIGVSVVRSGHPTYVFGTNRPSDHPPGRAFDTLRIDGRRVVDRETPRLLVVGYMEAAAAAGSYNVGGPYVVGAAPQFFSDDTHRDHVHAGFTA